jgi:hypothetical protein
MLRWDVARLLVVIKWLMINKQKNRNNMSVNSLILNSLDKTPLYSIKIVEEGS